jgi:hypoxanthine phosphoribosyltransferase
MNTPASTDKDLWVSWDEYNRLVERLALQVYESNWKFDMVLCLARGGVRPGDVISRIFDVPLAILSTSSYREEAGTKQGNLDIAKYMTMTKGPLAGRILLVDDLADSGVTLMKVREHLKANYPTSPKCARPSSGSRAPRRSSRTTTWKTCRTIRGSTSRSRITTACVRTSCRRG